MRTSSSRATVLGALASFWLGCVHSPKWEAQSRAQLGELASFDMACPKESLELGLIAGQSWNGIGSQAAVTGCGKRNRYIRIEGAGWVLNATPP
jgi:hypothetical protein